MSRRAPLLLPARASAAARARAARLARAGRLLMLCALLAYGSLASGRAANALTIGVDFTSSTHQVTSTDTYSSLLAQHQAGTALGSGTVTSLGNVSTAVYAPGVTSNYSLMMTVDLGVAQAGLYTFQVGVDWGRGGVAAVIDTGSGSVLSETVRTNDLWWNNNWADPDVFTTSLNLEAGQWYTLAWIGFEDCCAGSSTIRFSFNAGAYQTIDSTNLAPYAIPTPEPGTGLLVAIGLAVLNTRRRSSTRGRARRSWSRSCRPRKFRPDRVRPVIRA
jgi:hypothetical protein